MRSSTSSLPRKMMATRWQIFSISESWWEEMKIVRPSRFSARIRSRTS